MKTYKYKDSVSVGELIRIEGFEGIFEVVEKSGCEGCFFHNLKKCNKTPRCSPLNTEPSKQFRKLTFPEKSIGWWYEQLPEPIRSEAFDAVHYNFDNDTEKTKNRLFEYKPKIENAILYGFIWAHSEKGQDYWENVVRNIRFNRLQKAPDPATDTTPEPKQPRKRPSRAFKVTGEIKAGTQVSPTYRLVKPVDSINKLANVFDNSKSVYNQKLGKIQNTAFMRGMGFSNIFKLCKEGKIWIVEPVESSKEYQLRDKPQQELEATEIEPKLLDKITIMAVFFGSAAFGFSILFLVLFFQTGAAIFKHEPFFFKLVGSVVSISTALFIRRKLKLNI